MNISSPTARVMVPRGLDQRFTNRLSSRPGISLQCYERFVDAGAIHTPLKGMQMELEAENKSDMTVHGMCSLELSVHGLVIHIDTVVVDLNCQAILGMDILGDATKLPFILDLVDGTLSGGGYETIQLHRFHAATECFAETTDTVCIPPHSEVMLWAKLKTNNGRRGPTARVVLALQTFVQEFGILVGRSLVRADADDWKVPILLYNSDPCTKKSKDCKCNPVIIPARTRIARVEEIQAIHNIGTRETERSTGECMLPPHLLDVLDAASELMSDQRARAANLLAKYIHTFSAPGTPITGRTEAVVHDIDTGSTRPIRCNPRKLSPKKIKIQQELVDKMLEDCKFQWTVACQYAFKALRALLIKAPVLAFPKEDLPYIVDTDTSDYGIGGVLSQNIEGTEHVIAYYSKSLNTAQHKCTTRRELLAVVATLDHFKGYVYIG